MDNDSIIRNHQRLIVNTVSSLTLPDESLHAMTPSFVSFQRMLADDLDDFIEPARSFEQKSGSKVFPEQVWRHLDDLNAILQEVLQLCNTPGDVDPPELATQWRMAKTLANEILSKNAWPGEINMAQSD